MDKIRHKFTATDGFVLSLITGVVLATVVFNIVLGKDMGGAIFDGIGKCSEDISAIRGGAVFARSWEIVSSQGFDPFFLLSLLLLHPQKLGGLLFFLRRSARRSAGHAKQEKHTQRHGDNVDHDSASFGAYSLD